MSLDKLKAEWKADLEEKWLEVLGKHSILYSADDCVYLKNKYCSTTLAKFKQGAAVQLFDKGVANLDEITPIIKFLSENFTLLIGLEIIKH